MLRSRQHVVKRLCSKRLCVCQLASARYLTKETHGGHSSSHPTENQSTTDVFDNSADVRKFQRDRIFDTFRQRGLPHLRRERFSEFLRSRTYLHAFHKRIEVLEALKLTSTQWAHLLQRNYSGLEKVLLSSAKNVEARASILRAELGYTSAEVADVVARFPNILLGLPQTLAERVGAMQQIFPAEWESELKASLAAFPKVLFVRTTMPGDNFRFLVVNVWDDDKGAARAALIDNLQVLAKQPEHIEAAFRRCVSELGLEPAKEMLRESPRNLRWSLTTTEGKHASTSQLLSTSPRPVNDTDLTGVAAEAHSESTQSSVLDKEVIPLGNPYARSSPFYYQLACTSPTCPKVFSTKRALLRHMEKHARPFVCSAEKCGKRFTTDAYRVAHEVTHNEAERPRFACSVCSDEFLSASALREHENRNQRDHASQRPQPLNIQSEDVAAGSSMFFRPETILEQRMQHTTPRPIYPTIVESDMVKPNKNPRMPVDTVLLEASAPACAFFGTSLESERTIPIASFLPSHSEPGEMAAKVLISLDMFRQEPHEYKLYLCGVMAEDSRKRSSFRATVVFAREEHRRWCDENLHALDEETNPVLRFGRSSGLWEVATRVLVGGESRKLNVTITVPGGVKLDSTGADPVWMDVARIDWAGKHAYCPCCEDRKFPGYSDLFEHISASHLDTLFDCPTCDASFTSRSCAASHQLTAHGVSRDEQLEAEQLASQHGSKLNDSPLLSTDPILAAEFHPAKNRLQNVHHRVANPDDYRQSSSSVVWWRCQSVAQHEFASKISHRVKYRTGCPYCLTERMSGPGEDSIARPKRMHART